MLVVFGTVALLLEYWRANKRYIQLREKYGRLNDAAQDYFEKPNVENQTKLLEIIDPKNTRGHR